MADSNMVSTIGALILGAGIMVFVIQVVYACYKGKPAERDPWDARTLEWITHNPPKEYNFAYTPVIKARDQHWENKYGTATVKMEKELPDSHGIHMPEPSWWPFVVSLGIFFAALGMVFHGQPLAAFGMSEGTVGLWVIIPGLALTFFGIVKWSLEGPGGYHLHPDSSEFKE